jgi:repressor of nif and glnA expression
MKFVFRTNRYLTIFIINSEIDKDKEMKDAENIEKLDSEFQQIEENLYFNSFNEKVVIPKFYCKIL